MAAVKTQKKKIVPEVKALKPLLKGNLTWRDADKLKEFLSPRGRILPAAQTGLDVKQQRKVVGIIKQSRHLGLLPFTTQN